MRCVTFKYKWNSKKVDQFVVLCLTNHTLNMTQGTIYLEGNDFVPEFMVLKMESAWLNLCCCL